MRAAYGGRTLTFRPPAEVVGTDGIDADWLARVRAALEPLGVTDVDVSAASLEAAFLALTAPRQRADRSRTMTRDHRQPPPRLTGAVRATPRPAMLTYARLDLRRQLRDRIGMFFVVGLPTFMYLVFGLGSDDPVGSGNVAMYVMISMAAYGAVTATTSVAGSAATEQVMGWGRQLGLTPMRPLAFVAAKAGVAMSVAAVPVSRSSPSAPRPAPAATGRLGVSRRSCGSGRRSSRSTAWRSAWSSAAPTRPASRPG